MVDSDSGILFSTKKKWISSPQKMRKLKYIFLNEKKTFWKRPHTLWLEVLKKAKWKDQQVVGRDWEREGYIDREGQNILITLSHKVKKLLDEKQNS